MSSVIWKPGDPDGQFSVQVSDPPWFYSNRKAGGERKNKAKFGGGASKHYPLMKDADLLAMADFVKALTPKNCAHLMWATLPRLDFGIELLKAWGFKYRTCAYVWVKTRKKSPQINLFGAEPGKIYGPGYYTASNAELVLLGVKGKMPPLKKMTPSIIEAPRQKHSKKPDEFFDAVDLLYPASNHRRIEMFSRAKREGWQAWGNQV